MSFKQLNRKYLAVCLIVLIQCLVPTVYAADTTTVLLKDNGKALINPSMGWTMHYYSNILTNYGSKLEPSDTLDDFPGLSVVYLRVPWSFIEIEEGKYNWELLDTPSQRWIEKGKRVALRITCCESWMRYATPEWVKKAGAKGYDFTPGRGTVEGGVFWEPQYDDPVFLAKLENFVKVLAKRYDGNPNVDFIDIGSYGVWGEGHTLASSRQTYGIETIQKHIDLYCKYFKKTLLCISDDFAGHDNRASRLPITDYAFSKNVTLRDDSIMVQPAPRHWYHSELAGQFWPTLPVILEHEHYGNAIKRKSWDKQLWKQSVEDYHASYMSIHWWPRVLLNENRATIDAINLRLGYRLQAKKVIWPQSVRIGEPFSIKTLLANAGVAPCYPGGYLAFTIKDEAGGIVATLIDEAFNVRELDIAKAGQEKTKVCNSHFVIAPLFKDEGRSFSRNIHPGMYDLYISIGKRDGTPAFELPYDRQDGFKRYYLGKIALIDR